MRIESARVWGSNKDGRDVFLAVCWRWIRTQRLGLSWSGHSSRRDHKCKSAWKWFCASLGCTIMRRLLAELLTSNSESLRAVVSSDEGICYCHDPSTQMRSPAWTCWAVFTRCGTLGPVTSPAALTHARSRCQSIMRQLSCYPHDPCWCRLRFPHPLTHSYTHTHTHTHTVIHTHTQLYTRTHTHTHAHVHTHTQLYTRTHTVIHAHTHTHSYTHTHARTHTHTHSHTHTHTHTVIHAHTHTHTHTHTHSYTHTHTHRQMIVLFSSLWTRLLHQAASRTDNRFIFFL